MTPVTERRTAQSIEIPPEVAMGVYGQYQKALAFQENCGASDLLSGLQQQWAVGDISAGLTARTAGFGDGLRFVGGAWQELTVCWPKQAFDIALTDPQLGPPEQRFGQNPWLVYPNCGFEELTYSYYCMGGSETEAGQFRAITICTQPERDGRISLTAFASGLNRPGYLTCPQAIESLELHRETSDLDYFNGRLASWFAKVVEAETRSDCWWPFADTKAKVEAMVDSRVADVSNGHGWRWLDTAHIIVTASQRNGPRFVHMLHPGMEGREYHPDTPLSSAVMAVVQERLIEG